MIPLFAIRKPFCLAFCLLAIPLALSRGLNAQEKPAPLKRVSLLAPLLGLSELPLQPWGAYSRLHRAPCFLTDRTQAHLFTFPIVVGQRRSETLLPVTGKRSVLGQEKRVFERFSLGLAPLMPATITDEPLSATGALANRKATPIAANTRGIYWEERIPFLPAKRTGTERLFGVNPTEPFWGEGEAQVVWFPANAEPVTEGVLFRVTLTNRSQARQTWFIDLLGGIDASEKGLPLEKLHITKDPNTGAPLLQHENSPVVFALAARSAPFVQQAWLVKSDWMQHPESTLDSNGILQPKERAKEGEQTPAWGMLTVDNIRLAPGEKRTITLAVGAGKDAESAQESAQTLLALVEETLPNGKPRTEPGLAKQAEQAQQTYGFKTGSPLFDGLIAQSFLNILQADMRRVGVASREIGADATEASYYPALSGLTALSWIPLRPEWAVVQTNSYLLAQLDPNRPITNAQSIPPTSLFALWELYQETHDRDLLEKGFPAAQRRYQELLDSGRLEKGQSLYRWSSPSALAQSQLTRPLSGLARSNAFHPEYSAFVYRASRTMERMAGVLGLPEKEEYRKEREATAKALNETLWDRSRGAYQPKSNGEALSSQETDSLVNLLPLICGADAIPSERFKALLQQLKDPETFWSKSGLRSLSRRSLGYSPEQQGRGGISFGLNWMLWRSLLDWGEIALAEELASNILTAYSHASETCGGYPEWLHGETGAPQGARDYSGDSCILWLLQMAYHKPGTVSTGWEGSVISHYYDATQDVARVALRIPEEGGHGFLLVAMGRPNGTYRLQEAKTGTIKASAKGVVAIPVPLGAGLHSFEIVPTPEGENKSS